MVYNSTLNDEDSFSASVFSNIVVSETSVLNFMLASAIYIGVMTSGVKKIMACIAVANSNLYWIMWLTKQSVFLMIFGHVIVLI